MDEIDAKILKELQNNSRIPSAELACMLEISEDEVEDFDKIYEELEHISMTVEALQLWCEKMKLTTKDK